MCACIKVDGIGLLVLHDAMPSGYITTHQHSHCASPPHLFPNGMAAVAVRPSAQLKCRGHKKINIPGSHSPCIMWIGTYHMITRVVRPLGIWRAF